MTHVLALGGEGEPGLKKKIGVLGTLPRMRSYSRGESVFNREIFSPVYDRRNLF